MKQMSCVTNDDSVKCLYRDTKLMDNEMERSYFKYKIQKIKLVQIGVLINNTLYTHIHSQRYKTQTITVNTHNLI